MTTNLTKQDLTRLHDALARSYNAKVRAGRAGKLGKNRPSEFALMLADMKGTLERTTAVIDRMEQASEDEAETKALLRALGGDRHE